MTEFCKPGTFAFPGAAGCQRCDDERLKQLVEATGDWTQGFGGMIVCSECGNKRCPKATWHENACTGSNEPNQPGSSYQTCRCEYATVDDRFIGRTSWRNPGCTFPHNN